MNATAMIPKAENPRLNRIRRVSGVLKAAVLIYLITPLCFAVGNLKGLHLANGPVNLRTL